MKFTPSFGKKVEITDPRTKLKKTLYLNRATRRKLGIKGNHGDN